MGSLLNGKVLLVAEVFKRTLDHLDLLIVLGNPYCIVLTEGIDNQDLIGKIQTFDKAFNVSCLIIGDGEGGDFLGCIQSVDYWGKSNNFDLKSFWDHMAKLPVLMYHRVSSGPGKGLTISVDNLRRQFEYLKAKGYRTWHLEELMDLNSLPAGKHLVITFDDATEDHLELVAPLLEETGLKATFFLPMGHLGKTDSWNQGAVQILTAEELRSLNPDHIELAHHSFAHQAYDQMDREALWNDLDLAVEKSLKEQLELSPAIAYPYGKFPRTSPEQENFEELLRDKNIRWGFRIGNRVNRFPFKNPYQIQRLDIKGEYSLGRFAWKLRFGKLL